MKTRTEIATRKQGERITPELVRLLLPMTTAIAATKKGLMELVHRMGLAALDELLREDATKLAGPKGHREPGRMRNHWVTTPGKPTFGGRRVHVPRPRVRDRDDGEVTLPMWEILNAADPLPARVEQQIALGVSTRRYADSTRSPPVDQATASNDGARAPRREDSQAAVM